MTDLFDPLDDEDEFQDDPDTKAVLGMIDAAIGKRKAQESYDWLCDLETKIEDRVDALMANPEVEG